MVAEGRPDVVLIMGKRFTKGQTVAVTITIVMETKPMLTVLNAIVNMPPRKPYNPNTAYGRRKRREEAQKYYDNLPPSQKAEVDSWSMGCLIAIVIIVLLIGFISGNMRGAVKWLSH
jgi:hypothetical protein